SLIMELADIFGWDIDFALDIRQGDQFKIVFEEEFLDGEKIANGNILAAEFINQNETFRAIRYVDSSGDVSYYTPEGESMRKAFLRAPLDFRRISDNFNPNRLHPVFKTVRAHRGTDYAANRGTPVWASGAGKVIASAYSSANGNYVVIQHGNNIQTKYLHLQKRHVKKGQKVKQKEKIGLVGSTGYATGPHLHYEFLISGVHRNPRTIVNKLPKAKSIGHVEMAQFLLQTTPIVAQLDAQDSATQYATAEQEESMKNKRL
ncbi:MAG: murein DD-endopeptidase MepM/ murein hydrolase activator NlpD, partial [Lentisphaeria bacterium]